MNLNFDLSYKDRYHSASQLARVITEKWVEDNMFCPHCGRESIEHFPNNKPVADFFCPNCGSEYELKSKNGIWGHRVNDGAYDTMIERITSNKNPGFFFMGYSRLEMKVTNFIFVPKYFFVPNIIEKRNPLAATARRAGWIGCNIIIDSIPKQGRIDIISDGHISEVNDVLEKVSRVSALKTDNILARGWLLDILSYINVIPKDIFTLSEIYAFEDLLSQKHPKNNNIRAKIRQQLQILRDKGIIEFLNKGEYQKL
mgnify:CR=1 FL=1